MQECAILAWHIPKRMNLAEVPAAPKAVAATSTWRETDLRHATSLEVPDCQVVAWRAEASHELIERVPLRTGMWRQTRCLPVLLLGPAGC